MSELDNYSINKAFKEMCRSCIDSALEDATNKDYIDDIQDYIDSGILEDHCILGEMSPDVVLNQMVAMITETYINQGIGLSTRRKPHLVRLRTAAGLSRPHAARLLGITSVDLYNIEWNGYPISLELRAKMKEVYKCTTRDLLRSK